MGRLNPGSPAMRKPLLVLSALLALGLLAAALPPVQDDGKAEARAKELLASFAGTWETEFSMTGMTSSKGLEVVKALPHGLSLVVTSTGDMGPMGPYEGHGLIGYYRKSGKCVHVWTDSMDPGISVSEGRWTDDGTSFIVEFKQDTGMGPMPVISTMHVDDKDHMTWTMRAKDTPEGSAPMMSQKYTRKP